MKRGLFAFSAITLVGLIATSMVLADGHAKAAAKVGGAAPMFSLEDQDGKVVNLADYADKVVVLEWFNNECPFCVAHYKNGAMVNLANKYKEKGVVWIAVNSTKNKTNADNKAIAGEWNIPFAVLNDSKGATGHAYGAKTTPHMFIVNKGQLVYAGAIDDSKGQGEAKTNYVAKALDEILAGQSVTEPVTTPYGCSVKYAS